MKLSSILLFPRQNAGADPFTWHPPWNCDPPSTIKYEVESPYPVLREKRNVCVVVRSIAMIVWRILVTGMTSRFLCAVFGRNRFGNRMSSG